MISGSIGGTSIFDFTQEYPINDPRDPDIQYATSTGWIYQSFTYLDPLPQGEFLLSFTLVNSQVLGGDPGQKFKALVDDVSIEAVDPVPEPGTMILVGTGIIGLATFGRKKLKI